MPITRSSTKLPLSHLPYNYCVRCGSAAQADLFLCTHCLMRGEEPPVEYQSAQHWHCSHCNEVLDRVRDFWPDGAFRSDHYYCLGCDYANEKGSNFNRRGFKRAAITYMAHALKQGRLPVHVAQAYHRQLDELPQIGVYMDEPVLPGD